MLHKGSLRTSSNRHGGGHDSSWAVSYADFLMVLLSFFIIFFSADSHNPLHKIMLDLSGKKQVSEVTYEDKGGRIDNIPGTGSGTGLAAGAGAGLDGAAGPGGKTATGEDAESIFSSIANDLTGVKVSSNKKSDWIAFDLPADIYKLGSYDAPIAELNKILPQLKKYSKEISITIIGHSDATAFNGNRPVIGSSNLTLSSVRAAYASIYVQKELPDVLVSTQASSNQNRNTRSLTFIIKLRQQGDEL
jgi:hypothetical protein